MALPFMSDKLYPNFYGRLYVPDVDINVALYNEGRQSTINRWDSAAIFKLANYNGANIIDLQFEKLFRVEVGMNGYIQLDNGKIVNICCVDVLDGHNIRSAIMDENGIVVNGRSDILMYTCGERVRVCLWEIVD